MSSRSMCRTTPNRCSSPMPRSTSSPISIPSATSSKCDRTCAGARDRTAQGGDPVGGGDGLSEDRLDDRCRGAVQDVGPTARSPAACLDGPLAFDNAVSENGGSGQGHRSEVAGDADILVVPDLEAGNMIAKQLIHLAGCRVGRDRPWRARPDRPDQPGRQRDVAVGLAAVAKIYIHHLRKAVT